MSQILQNYVFLLFWRIFGEIHRELYFLDIKETISETSTWNTQKVCFSYLVWKGKSWGKFGFVETTVFDQTSKRELILTKTVFLLKVSQILQNYAFLLFWRIFGEIHRELYFLDIKETISETSTEIVRKIVFLTMFERGKSCGKFGIV